MASDYGIKVSQERYDVEDAEDYKLEFSSGWPTLNIVDSGTYTTTGATTDISVHNLGYRPMVLVWTLSNTDPFVSGDTARFNNSTSSLLEFNDVRFREKGFLGAPVGDVYFYMIFTVDLDTSFTSANINTGEATDLEAQRDRDYGIKISQEGFEADGETLSQFVLNSATRSPMVDTVTQHDSATSPIEITHNLGYPPQAYAYVEDYNNPNQSVGYLRFLEMNAESTLNASLTTSSTTVDLNHSGSNVDIRLVVVKDPMTVN